MIEGQRERRSNGVEHGYPDYVLVFTAEKSIWGVDGWIHA